MSSEPGTYFPAFSTRSAEIRALRELDGRILDRILPVVELTRDLGATSFQEALHGVQEITGNRPIVVDFDPKPRKETSEAEAALKRRDADRRRAAEGKPPRHQTDKQEAHHSAQRQATRDFNRSLIQMLDPAAGYRNWINFATGSPYTIPVVRIGDEEAMVAQARALLNANRKMAFRISPQDDVTMRKLVGILKRLQSPSQAIVILDAGNIRGRSSLATADMISAIQYLVREVPLASAIRTVAMSGSFPAKLADFVIPGDEESVTPLEIEERSLYQDVQRKFEFVSYGDHSAVQPRSDRSGGNGYHAHVEIAHANRWYFSRSAMLSYGRGFVECADRLVRRRDVWDRRSDSWGSRMVARAASGSLDDGLVPPGKFGGPGPWVGPRVNQHITVQALLT